MKNNKKNNVLDLILLIVTFALILSMFSTFFPNSFYPSDENVIVLTLAIALVTLTIILYLLLLIKRTNPKKYIYISYCRSDEEIANKIASILEEQLKKLSKYRFEIITADSIPFGNDMRSTMQKNMAKSDIVIVIVSPSYLRSEWCLKEYMTICNENKRIIPVVIDSFSDLSKLPKDISNIKALSLRNCKSEQDFSKAILLLAKDLIKQRMD